MHALDTINVIPATVTLLRFVSLIIIRHDCIIYPSIYTYIHVRYESEQPLRVTDVSLEIEENEMIATDRDQNP